MEKNMENLQMEYELTDVDTESRSLALAKRAQYELLENWFYADKKVSELTDYFFDKIENFKSTQLHSIADKFDHRCKYDIALESLAIKGDFIILTDIQNSRTETCGKSRRQRVSTSNFHSSLIIAFYPESELIISMSYEQIISFNPDY